MAWGMQGVGAMEATLKTPSGALKIWAHPSSSNVEITVVEGVSGGAKSTTSTVILPKERLYIWLNLAMAVLDDCKDDQPEGP
ncbi:hypothetical protein LCGC14_1740740 [marine sediment metagenome]|uniref:Uncharacterized protein n=1 Tax=marine sediment metagenome TaxID=412755 RepID=A0A0F9HUE3_9ZZZZ